MQFVIVRPGDGTEGVGRHQVRRQNLGFAYLCGDNHLPVGDNNF